jgi:hypothetical protein
MMLRHQLAIMQERVNHLERQQEQQEQSSSDPTPEEQDSGNGTDEEKDKGEGKDKSQASDDSDVFLTIKREGVDDETVLFQDGDDVASIIDTYVVLQHGMEGMHQHSYDLYFEGRHIDDAEEISKSRHGDVFVAIPVAPWLEFYVRAPDGKSFSVNLQTDATIENTKIKIEALSGHPVARQCLSLRGVEMDDTRTLEDYGMARSSDDVVMTLKESDNKEQDSGNGTDAATSGMQIFVCTFPDADESVGEVFSVDVDAGDTIDQLKLTIQDKTGWEPEQQRLTFRGSTCSATRVPRTRASVPATLSGSTSMMTAAAAATARPPASASWLSSPPDTRTSPSW